MNYSSLLLWLSFALCLSLTAGGVLLVFRIEQSRRGIIQYLQYFLISLYVFGYYSLWSKILLTQFLETENAGSLINIISQMGVPFFIISLMMQLVWANKTVIKPSKSIFLVSIFSSFVLISIFLQWGWPVIDKVRTAYSLAGFIVAFVVLGIFAVQKSAVMSREWTHYLSVILACSGLIHLTYFTRLAQHEYYEIVFVFFFFLFNTALVVVFTYTAKLGQASRSFEGFVLQYGITRRETDIMQGIYAGKTNQEIANQLFITLQTVKDHSSRIYQKTQVRNRAQLSALLRETQIVTDAATD